MTDKEIKRPSTWLISFGLALMWACARALGDLERGAGRIPAYYLLLGLQVFGTLLALLSFGYGLLLAVWFAPELVARWRNLRPIKPTTPDKSDKMVAYTRIIPGTANGQPRTLALEDMRPARWSAWNDTALEVMYWYRVTGSLIYGVMAGRGKAFKKNTDAQMVYEEMDRLGLVVLVNGKTTVLADSVPSVMAAIRGGKLDWTDAHDPPSISPAPLRERPAASVVISA